MSQAVLSPNKIRAGIQRIQEEMEKHPASSSDPGFYPLKHAYADNCYVREIFIPAGELVVGKIHKHSHPNFLLEGEVSVITESGGLERLKAPLSIISPAGTKRVVYTHTDCRWVTVHVTDKTDLKEIEDEVISKDYSGLSLEAKEAVKCLG